MATTSQGKKLERMEQRVPAHVKRTIEHAAALEGRSASDFVTQAALSAANEAIKTHEIVTIAREHAEAFVEAMLRPQEPNEALKKAAGRHRERYGSR